MITEMSKRKYTLKRRAQRQQATRDRIVEATIALHEKLGVRDTTVSAIAELAGVQRLTVYRHFPDDSALLQACTTRWIARNPPPDPGGWQEVTDPAARSRRALGALYAYYRSTHGMWEKAYRDVGEFPVLAARLQGFEDYLGGVRDDLAASWNPSASGASTSRRRRLRALLGHAVRFTTWQSLSREGLRDGAMADLVVAWLGAAAETGPLPVNAG